MNSKNIMIGQYVEGNGLLHKLDPRLKIFLSIVLLVSLFLIPANSINNLYVLLGFIGLMLLIMIISKINLLSVLKGLQSVLFIAVLTFVLQLIYSNQGDIAYTVNMHFSILTIIALVLLVLIWFFSSKYVKLKFLYFLLFVILGFLLLIFIDYKTFSKPSFDIYNEGLVRGSFFAIRIVGVIIISTMLTISTSTTDINMAIEWLLYPLKLIKLPVSEFSMMLSLTLRFIPTLMIETDKIMRAQASRGIDFNEGNFFDKARQLVTLLVPIFAISITKASDLANAMEARGYVVGAKRTNIDILRFKWKDLCALIFISLVLTTIIVLRIVL